MSSRAPKVRHAATPETRGRFYDPENLQKARSTLRTAERIHSIDPGGAHIALREAAMRARTAFENSVRLAAERLRLLLADRIEELREIHELDCLDKSPRTSEGLHRRSAGAPGGRVRPESLASVPKGGGRPPPPRLDDYGLALQAVRYV